MAIELLRYGWCDCGPEFLVSFNFNNLNLNLNMASDYHIR